MPTISFVVTAGKNGEPALKSKTVIDEFDKDGKIGIRYGHFYAYYLIQGLDPKLDPADGVIRVSFVHYNTKAEVERFIQTLDKILFP